MATSLVQKYLVFIFLIFLLVGNAKTSAAQVVLEHHEEMHMEGLRFWYSDPSKISHIFNRNIAVHGDCFTIKNGYVFFVWYKGGMENRDLMLSRKKIGTEGWVTIQFPNKNTLYDGDRNGVDATGAGDSHKTAAVGVCPIDGTVHLAYDMHVHPLKYRVSDKNIAFAPDSEFTLENFSEQRDYFREDLPIDKFTYPSFVNNDAGELIVEYRLGTSRQGDKYITYYDGSNWSELILLVKGDNEDPQFNQYGGLSYHFGKMYLACAIRQYGSPITYNQGFYFAEAGQHGDEDWKNLNGESFQLPIRGLTKFNNFKVCEPLPPGNDGMTSSPDMVVSKNGAIHMVNRVPNIGFVHYHTKVGGKIMEKASSSPSSLNFGGNDARIYSVEISDGRIRVKSSPEGESNWRTDYIWGRSERFGLLKSNYYNGKIYIVASEDVDSDRLPLHFIVLDIVNDNKVPDGYTFVCNENELVTVNATADIAYGADGQFHFLYNVSDDLTCTDENFGDPIPGVDKKCYVKLKYPFVNFYSPPRDTVLYGNYPNFMVNVTAADSGGTIKHVALFIDTVLVRTDSVAPFSWGNPPYSNELLGIECGKHTLKVVATDNDGLTSSDEFSFFVSREECFPRLSFITPQKDTTIALGDAFFVQADLSNNFGVVEKVRLFVNGRLIREISKEPFVWGDSLHPNEILAPSGTNDLKISATNSLGFTAEKTIRLIVEPPVYQIPGKIEAEYFASMKGIQTKESNDTGGGLFVDAGSGDWMSYEVNIDSSTVYQVEYRVAAESNPVRFYTRIDGSEADRVESPATGDAQNWISVKQNVYLLKGRHTLRLDALGKFSINWINFSFPSSVGAGSILENEVLVYPNPANESVTIHLGNNESTIKIYNSTGTKVYEDTRAKNQYILPASRLGESGVYYIRINNQTKKLVLNRLKP